MKKTVLIVGILLISFFNIPIKAQNNKAYGVVIDSETKLPLAFVNIIYNSKNHGVTTDIDGKFTINNLDEIEYLKFGYLGYESKQINKTYIKAGSFIAVNLDKAVFNINEVVVFPGENPAHRIINKVLENRNLNNPEKYNNYSYNSYNKMVFTVDMEHAAKLIKDTTSLKVIKDSSLSNIKRFFDNQFLFLIESVSERKYEKPGKINEEVIASRVSGFKEPSFILLATQMQSFSFYDEMITLVESRYINPISTGSTNRYFFNIIDTTFTERGDTVFSISFKPKKNKNFEGLEGLLNINTYKYAIQSVVATPVESNGILDINILQNYTLIDDKYWFPSELNTDLIFGDFANIESKSFKSRFVGIGKSYLTKIKVNENEKTKFKAIELEVNNSAYHLSDSIWDKYRNQPLNKKELRTYEYTDSAGKSVNLDLKLKTLKTLSTGSIPFYFVDIAIIDLFNFNFYEGFRPGLGFKTNQKLSPYFSIGAYSAYGFKDEAFKYGGNFTLNLAPKQELQLGFDYRNDVIESSGYQFFNVNGGLSSTESYRQLYINDMTYSEDFTTSLQFRILKKLKVNILARNFLCKNTSPYSFFNQQITDEPATQYRFNEAGIQFKFAPNEKLAYLAGDLMTSNPNNSPVFYFNVFKGFKNNGGEFNYLKLEARLDINFLTKGFGRTNLNIVGGRVMGDLPYFMLYNGHGSYYDFDVETANSFATMRMNEFLSDQFVSIYFRQDFGGLIFKSKKFKPKIILTTSAGFGQLQKPGLHQSIEFKTMEKGYYESGIVVNNIIKPYRFMGMGFGVFYRYGSYSFSNNSDNFAFKFSLTFDL